MVFGGKFEHEPESKATFTLLSVFMNEFIAMASVGGIKFIKTKIQANEIKIPDRSLLVLFMLIIIKHLLIFLNN